MVVINQDVERIYELSSMQEAMLVASLVAPDSGVYLTQIALRLSSRLDVAAFERAWRLLLDRHEILRTGFYWEDQEKPVQVVYREVDLPLQRESWRGLAAAEQEERLQAFLDADREQGFDLGAPPLLRLALIELDGGEWQIVWSMHHILTDGWSRALLLRELFESYAAFAAGREPELAAPRPFEDYIVWLQRLDPGAAEAFWRESLAGFSSPTLLAGTAGTNGHGPLAESTASFRASRVRSGHLPAAETAALHELARRHHLTLAILVYGAWALVVAQETGAGEVVFGGTVTGRPLELAGVESMVGLFINTLPVRVAVDPARGLLPWLADLQEWQSRARQHESAPLADIHSWSSLQAGVPLFDNILVIENFSVDGSLAERLPDLGVSSVRTSELTGYPLHVVVFPGSELQLDFIYDARRVDDAAAARMEERLASALRAFAAAPQARLGEVPLLLPGERQQVVVEHNDTAARFPADLCLHELVAAQAARMPQVVAVRGAHRELRYGELMTLSGRLARRLVKLGVGPEVLVGVCAERTPSLPVALLGVLEAGGAYVPLDPTHPRERLGWILADSQARVILTERSLLDVLPPHGAQVVLLDEEEGDEAAERALPVTAENLVYVIYTSGSTGRPKGVELRHRGVVNYLASMASRPGLGAGDVMLAVTTLSFDIAVTELFLPLTVGACVELVDRDTAGDATLLAAALESSEATCMQATPATWSLLAEGGWPGRPGLKALCGGEALPRALAEKLLPRVAELWNMYGPTETTVWSALLRVESGEGPVPVGLPLANTSLHLVSRQGGVAPLGAVGELAIGGEGLARGYHRRPDLTAERFVPDPFGEPGDRLYRTGDLARRQPEGTLEFLGRSDHQVKLRGFRIELGEIEAVLASHPAVRECVVVARQDGDRDKMLVGYIVFRTEPVEAGALRGFLAAKLPPYMVPAVFIPLAALPLSPAGKVDRNALPAPVPGEAGPGEERLAPPPADPTAELVAVILAEVLGRERVGIDDDFFALGGHSLLATRVVSRLRNVLGVELPLRSVLEQRTAGSLAAAVRAELQGGRLVAPLRPVPRQDGLPLSFVQERFWFIDQLEPESPRYNIAVAVRLTGPLAVLRLERAFAEVARRHEVLRTTFGSRNGRPVQIIAPEPRLALPVVDLSVLERERREAAARHLAAAESLLPFDLEAGPLLRLTLVRLDGLEGEDHLLLATLHHIVADAWSLVLLVREVQALYRAWSHGAASPLPELPIQYADFAAWQRQWLDGEGLERQLAYWRERLDGSTGVLELPVDRPRPALLSLRGGEHRFAIDRELARRIQALGRQAGATPFMITTAALCTLLSRLSGEPDLTLAAPIAARQRLELESLIGCFVNTLVLRVDAGRAETFLDLLEQAREVSLGAYAHQDLPFERLVNELQPERDLSRSPLAQVALSFQNIGLPEADLDGLRMVSQDPPSQVAKFDLAFVFAEDREGGLSGWLQYASDLYDPTTAVRLAQHLTCCLDELTAWPEQPLADLSYLTAGERQQALYEWNDTAGPAPDVMLHQLFEAQAGERPDATAVVWEGIEQTYAELEARANRVAGLLARLAGPGAAVGVWMERSHHTVAALLGILKAGGTYVPLDPAWPAERVETILAAIGATVAVVSRATLPAAEALRWRLPRLRDLVCPDVETPEVETEAVDEAGVRALWDVVSARATDRVTAGGFLSSFTGQPLREAEVDEYRDRVLALAEPWLRPGARVLEVGCGAGLILWEMARRVERCVGLDPSPRTQQRNREHARAAGIANVELAEGFAHEIGGRFAPGSFDLVVMASTAQFFPGPRYLEKVVAAALQLLAPGGALLLADVPDARREAELRDELAAAGVPAKRGERELWLDEELFRDLPGAGPAEILHRTKGFSNELRYRYDVLLQAETGAPRQRSKRLWTGWHVEQHPATRPSGVRSPDEIAYVIHTSGSTGAPKGIAVQHRPAAGLIRWVNETFEVGPDDRLLFITPLTFDLSVYDVFGILAAGGTVQVAPESALGNAERLVRLLRETPVTIWDSAPAALQQLAPLFPPAAVGAESALRLVLLSGDWIPVRLPDQVRAGFPGARVVALGGATEATVWSNWYPVAEVDPRWPSIPYGRPITGARYHVLDAGAQPCPIGVPGDLYIGGSCLCTGYAGQPELTAVTFVPDPFAPPAERGARLYRTGDRTKAWWDGTLEFLGRADQRVKVRGYRIEPGEIEVALLRHPALREAVVTVREDRPGDQMLVAYVVPREEAPAADELRAWLRGRLPSYMVPAACVPLAALPVTANGKLDRSRLPDPRQEREEESYTAPSDAVEELLAGLFADLLDLDRVGTGDSFFTLGGHSLLATQLLSRVRERLGVELILAQLFEGPTVADLAREVRAAQQAGASAAPPVLPVPRPASAELPLSFAQQRLWFVDQLEPGNPAYNIPWAARLGGSLDAGLLRRILAEVVRRHEALRTTFARSPRGPVTRVQESRPVPLPVVSLEGLPKDRVAAEVRRLVAAEALGAFDLARGPLLRATLLRLAPREHVLTAVMHHIVSDGWSMGVLLREVGALYQAFAAGESSPLPELPIQYADFAVWQREWLQGEVLAGQLAWWRDELAGAPQVLELPLDRPRPAGPAHRAGVLTTVLAPDLSRELAAFSRREGVTLFMSLLAAFGVLLGRLANQEDVLVGSPVANRNRREIEELIGFFVNTLVLRVPLHGTPQPSFREVLVRVRQAALGAYTHQDLPFERLVEELVTDRADRTGGPPPLFQVMLGVQNAPVAPLELPGLAVSPLALDGGVAKFDLTLQLMETAAGLTGWLEYDAELFDRTTAERLLARLEGLLRSALAAPDRRVGELGVLLEGEREQLVREWNDSASVYPREAALGDLFAEHARRQPKAPAVVEAGGTWSYGRLEAEANRLAWHLRSLGVEREMRVGVAMERSTALILALLAVVKAGGTYVPLDAGYPDERLRFMLEDASAPVVLVHGRTRQRLLDLAGGAEPWRLVCVEQDRDEIEACPVTALPSAGGGEQLAYLTYTSGSTGRPKGVAVPQRAVVRLVQGTDYVQLGPDDRVAHASNVSFDATTFEIWGPLANGGAVVVIDREVALSPGRLAEHLRQERVTAMFLTTALFNQVVRDEPTAFYPLRHLMVGGEALDPALMGRALSEGPPERLLQVYGPTESTTFAVWGEVWEIPAGALSVPLGRPLANTTVYVVDAAGELAALGQVGELWLGGGGLARGYLNRPDLTAERFVPDGWSGGPGERLYRTGDLVRWRQDGRLDFLGRLDAQVKIRGFRIEPGEVEAVLAACPGVRECAVLARRAASGDPSGQPGELRLVAYLVAAPGWGLREAAVRDFLKQALPDYMVPATFLFLDALPLTPNGKVDRAALPAPEGVTSAAGRDDGSMAPRDPVEGLLAGIWEEVLGRERVGVTDDFFALGGHSLLATQVVSRIRETFGVELPVHDLFERPTIAQLAAELQPLLQGRALLGEVPPILPVPRSPGDELPLSFAQQRLWFVEQLEPDTLFSNMPWAMRLTGALDADRLRRTLEEVVRRHEALRMTFHGSSRGPVSRILESQPMPLPVISLEALPESAAEAEVRRLGLRELLRPFDLENGPLLRAILVRLGAREHALIPVMHHIVSDGWSMGVLQREVALLYGAFSHGDVSPLPELPIQYADFAIWQREWLQGEVLAVQLAYWRDALAGAPLLLELPTDRPRPVEPTHRGGALPAQLSPSLTRELEAFSRREGVTPFMTLLAAFGVLLGRLAHQEDVLVGSPVANRTRREIEDLIGFFVNTLVLRVVMRGTPPPSFRELLGRVREAALGAYTHQDLPFERLVEELVTDREGGHPPLVQVVFALQNAPAGALELPGLTLRPYVIENGLARFDLTLVLADSPAGFQGYVEYDADLFDRTTAERLLDRLTGLLESALAGPDQGVEGLELLLAGEREQLLLGWNDTARAYPREAGLPGLFAQVARELPEEPAILAPGGEVWTYRRLDEESSRLALRLSSLGVGAETPVGIAMERSPELILGMLAILKAGGIYVPLDAGYPDERLSFMLEDTGAQVVLVHDGTRERMAALRPLPRLELVAWGGASGEESREEGRGIGGDALAYVIYTSGSTGRPKGVAVTHRAIVRLVRETNYVHLGPGARLGHVANISFDAATYEIWGALLTGAAVAVIPRETVLDPRAFAAALREQRVTSMFLTSSLFTRMAQEVPDAFQHMSELLVGGEAVDPAAARRVLAHRPPRRLLNGYGPTESTTFATWHPIREIPAGATGIPIGLPLANTTAYVLDRWHGLVPPGSTGELCLGGDGLARGYWNRPELTAERFVPHPWGDGERLYRTGDLARQLPDGTAEYLGRLDDQVKIRGFRIEPGEIEVVLAGHPAVRECAILARQGGAAGGIHLVAYLVVGAPAAGDDPEASLRAWLQERLPEYLVPSAWVFLEALPLTANGKLDRGALPAPQGRSAEDRGHVAPSGPVEETLAAIWAEVLGLDRIGAHDDFFALGGHSLLATQVVTRVREVLGVTLPLRHIFTTPTLAALARSIESGLPRSTVPEAPPLEAVPRDRPLPLSYSQQQFWFLHRMEPESSAYTIFLPFHFAGRLDAAILAWTLDEIVRRHEVLRTTFVDVDGAPEQRIAARAALALPQVDLGGLATERREAELRRLAREERRRPFDLAAGPLLRVLLVRLGATEHTVLAALHHIAGDGWSLGVLTREIGALYAARCAKRTAALPDLPIQYADFAHWQRRWLSGEVLEEQLAYWRERLGGAREALRLPTERPRHEVADARSASSTVALSRGVSAELAALSRSADATLFMTLLAGFMALLRCYAQQEDIVVGTPIANRKRIETEGLIGPFTNTLVLRADLSGNPTFRELIARVREAALGAYAHQDLPFVTLVESLRLERDPSRSPLFQVLFALQNAPEMALDLPDLVLRPLELKEGEARHDLQLDLTETPEGIRGRLEYKTALFRPLVVEQMARDLEALLELVTRDPEVRLDQLESELVELARRLREQREDELQQSISRDLRSLKGGTGRRAPMVVRRGPGDGSGSRDEERQ